MKLCVYSEDGTTKYIDVTSGTIAAGVNNITISGGVTLPAGNYYVAMGCATTCSGTVSTWTTTSLAGFNTTAVPSGKKVYEGTVTMTSGTCNSTITPTTAGITASNSKTPAIRFDN